MKNLSLLTTGALLAAGTFSFAAQSATVAAAGGGASASGAPVAAGGTIASGGVNGPAAGGSVAYNGVNASSAGGSVATGGVNGPAAGAVNNGNVITPNPASLPLGTTTTTTYAPVPTTTNATPSNWNSENGYWHDNYPNRTYYNRQRDYSTYEPAYHYGVDIYNQNGGKPYNQLNQSQVGSGWNNAHSTSNLNWNDAQAATRDAYERMYQMNHNGTNGTATTVVNGVAVTNR